MAILVYRIYSNYNSASGPEFPEDHFMSIVADDNSAKYVFAKDSEVGGLDDQRIEYLKVHLWGDEKPSTAEDWVNIAYYRINGDFSAIEDYKSLAEAISKEEAALEDAKKIKDNLS